MIREVDHDFFNIINEIFDNKLPPNVQYLKIEMSIDDPVSITVKYTPDTMTNEQINKRFTII